MPMDPCFCIVEEFRHSLVGAWGSDSPARCGAKEQHPASQAEGSAGTLLSRAGTGNTTGTNAACLCMAKLRREKPEAPSQHNQKPQSLNLWSNSAMVEHAAQSTQDRLGWLGDSLALRVSSLCRWSPEEEGWVFKILVSSQEEEAVKIK